MVTAFRIPSDSNPTWAFTQQPLPPLESGKSPTHENHFVLTFILFFHIISEITPTCHSAKMGSSRMSRGLISRCAVESCRSVRSGADHPYHMCGLHSLKTTAGCSAWSWESSMDQHRWRDLSMTSGVLMDSLGVWKCTLRPTSSVFLCLAFSKDI